MKTNLHHLDRYRVRDRGEFGSSPAGARYGAFIIPVPGAKPQAFVLIVDDGGGEIATGWEHVSVHVAIDPVLHMHRCPTWSEMCLVKGLFWENDEVVVQYHIDNEAKVNVHPTTLHLWRPIAGNLPLPDTKMV